MISIQRIVNARPSAKPVKQYSLEDLEALREQDAQKLSSECVAHKKKTRSESAIGRSGILPKYQGCSFDNFICNAAGKQKVVKSALDWVESQTRQESSGGFIFAGMHGTGKNHLASAIANLYIEDNQTAVIITVSDLMVRLRDTYRDDSSETEDGFIRKLANVDLLVIDEVGVQRNTVNEQVTLSTLINARDANNKPTGVLTNLDFNGLIKTMGERSVDRILSGVGIWLTFDWGSFRTSGVNHAV
ncbi:ATP-binding protein [Shewanella sp. 202IG2-18]|uniref:ATP-binding protein n=1 Tax=Parashewanella hymeniacidonis TaxID=2807618 RepID=UPI00195FADDC|nr:ATP-binding protein [Parashewanella hymeniacidonis]MBM7070898.1 ATP-binding protein [Parashewanella hymeniacidonis]